MVDKIDELNIFLIVVPLMRPLLKNIKINVL